MAFKNKFFKFAFASFLLLPFLLMGCLNSPTVQTSPTSSASQASTQDNNGATGGQNPPTQPSQPSNPIPTPTPIPVPQQPSQPTPPPTSIQPASLQVVSGQGQVQNAYWEFAEVFGVRAYDSQGRVLTNVPVVWEVVQGKDFIQLRSATASTDSSGYAEVKGMAQSAPPGEDYGLIALKAKIPSTSIESPLFYASIVRDPRRFATPYQNIVTPSDTNEIVVKAGQTLKDGLQISFAHSTGYRSGTAMEKVGFWIRIKPEDEVPMSDLPTAECVGGTVLSNAKGVASCDIKVGMRTGSAMLIIRLYGLTELINIRLRVIP